MSKLTKALTAAAGNAGSDPLYAEDVFSTYLWEGTNSANTIENGIDLAGEGGLVWSKWRSITNDHMLVDTERGALKVIKSNSTGAQVTNGNNAPSSFLSNGFTYTDNGSGYPIASWTFRKAEKFFDVVTYTGNGSTTYAHSLNAIPAFVLYKATSTTSSWLACTRKNDGSYVVNILNGTTGTIFSYADADAMGLTETTFNPNPTGASSVGTEYVAYLFASDAGGFGDDGSESIIKCGSYVGTGSATVPNHVELGFEPQYWLFKNTTRAADWWCIDTMRGADYSGTARLFPNTSGAEFAAGLNVVPTATGFDLYNNNDSHNRSGDNYIYIAIRRPMKTPESGTEVFKPTAAASFDQYSVGFPTDLFLAAIRSGNAINFLASDRLRGSTKYLTTSSTGSEQTDGGGIAEFDLQNNFDQGLSSSSQIRYNFKRATGFFDVVAYTGDGAATQDITHNLGVSPDFIVVKQRTNSGTQWPQWASAVPNYSRYMNLTSGGFQTGGQPAYVGQSVSSTTFRVSTDGSANQSNGSGNNYIAYLFATLAGVSKVGSYTGTGSNVDVDCGFSAGARFILIKRTDSTGDWYVYDSVRGIVAGNDPYLLLNSSAAEVTSTDYIDPLSSGFTVTSSAPAALNASGGNYIFLAIA
jgi:hypothetical protein